MRWIVASVALAGLMAAGCGTEADDFIPSVVVAVSTPAPFYANRLPSGST